MLLRAAPPVEEKGEGILDADHFVAGKGSLKRNGIQGDAEEFQRCCRADRLLGRERNAKASESCRQTSKTSVRRRGGGIKDEKVIQQMNHVRNAINVEEDPGQRFGQSVENLGAALAAEREADREIISLTPTYPEKVPEIGMQRDNLKGGDDVRLGQPGATPEEADEGDGIIHAGIRHRKVGAGN